MYGSSAPWSYGSGGSACLPACWAAVAVAAMVFLLGLSVSVPVTTRRPEEKFPRSRAAPGLLPVGCPISSRRGCGSRWCRSHGRHTMALFSDAGIQFLLRWIHFLSGITWIGLLYYFNFVQGPFFAEADASTKSVATQKLVPRALWWFRWAAALTFLTGLMILGFQQQMKGSYFKTLPGMSIFAGALMATVMFLNVWLIIWPNQKIAIASAQRVMGGGEADPAAAGAARRGLIASRTNTLFSIPVMFFMVGTSHFAAVSDHLKILPSNSTKVVWYLVVGVLTLLIEANALGLVGGVGPGPTRKPLESHKDTIIAGLVLWAAMFALMLAL